MNYRRCAPAPVCGLIVIAGLLLPIWSGDAETQPALGSMRESGELIYRRNCGACHGNDARGGGPVAASLRNPPPDLTAIAQRRGGTFPAGEIAALIDGRTEVVAHGTREMPVWGETFGTAAGGGETGDEVTRGKVAYVVEYLKSIQR